MGDSTGVGGADEERGDPLAGRPDVDATVPERAPSPFEDVDLFNVPNAFTFLRVLLVPLVLWLLTLQSTAGRWWAFWVFVFAAWTDSFDGWVARRFGRVTRWGQFADPLADKLLVLGTLASLAIVGQVPWWAVLVILAREVAVTVMRVRVVRADGLVIPASVWGKVKTVTQIVAIGAYLAPVIPHALADVLLWVAVVATVVSGVVYGIDVRRGSAGRRDAGDHDGAGEGP